MFKVTTFAWLRQELRRVYVSVLQAVNINDTWHEGCIT